MLWVEMAVLVLIGLSLFYIVNQIGKLRVELAKLRRDREVTHCLIQIQSEHLLFEMKKELYYLASEMKEEERSNPLATLVLSEEEYRLWEGLMEHEIAEIKYKYQKQEVHAEKVYYDRSETLLERFDMKLEND